MIDSITLYVEASWSSPWVCTAYVALREKALPFTTAMAMLRPGSGAIDQMLAHTLTGTAPVLQHDTFWLAESLAIVEYLEEILPEPRLFPDDVRQRAVARQLMAWMRHHHEVLRRERPSEWIMYPRKAQLPPLSKMARDAADDLVRVVDRLGGGGHGHVLGGRFGIVDVELAFALRRLVSSGLVVPDQVAAYTAAVWARPSVREFVEHARPPNPPISMST